MFKFKPQELILAHKFLSIHFIRKREPRATHAPSVKPPQSPACLQSSPVAEAIYYYYFLPTCTIPKTTAIILNIPGSLSFFQTLPILIIPRHPCFPWQYKSHHNSSVRSRPPKPKKESLHLTREGMGMSASLLTCYPNFTLSRSALLLRNIIYTTATKVQHTR